MTRTAALALLLVGCSGASKPDPNIVPADFGAGATKFREWSKGKETWVQVDSFIVTDKGITVVFKVANKGAAPKTYDPAAFDMMVTDHAGNVVREPKTIGIPGAVKPGEQTDFNAKVSNPFAISSRRTTWAATIAVPGKAFGEEKDFLFVVDAQHQ